MENKTHWSFWLIAIISVIWNLGGAVDYSMTHLHVESYMSQMTAEQAEYFYSFPAWATFFWALGVWGAMIGSILLLLRTRFAVTSFAISLVGLAGSSFYQFTNDAPASMTSPGSLAFWAAICLIAILLMWYAMRMRKQGVLR